MHLIGENFPNAVLELLQTLLGLTLLPRVLRANEGRRGVDGCSEILQKWGSGSLRLQRETKNDLSNDVENSLSRFLFHVERVVLLGECAKALVEDQDLLGDHAGHRLHVGRGEAGSDHAVVVLPPLAVGGGDTVDAGEGAKELFN